MNDDALLAALGERITSLSPELTDIRRDVHAHPELSREETRTTEMVVRRLDAAGVAVRLMPGTGVLADLGAPEPVYRIALRADMDALPVRERSGVEFASTDQLESLKISFLRITYPAKTFSFERKGRRGST